MNNDLEDFYTAPQVIGGDSGIAADRRDFYFTWNLNSTLQYKKDINSNNSIDVLIGFNPSETTEKFSYVSQTGFPVTSYTQPQQGDTILAGVAGTGRQYSFLSYFARLNYKLFGRFLFGLSFRIDGSSRFAPGNQYGYFPAGSFGWVISDEQFMKHQSKMSLFKLRASLGTTGNSDMTTDFAYLSAFSGGKGYAGSIGILPANLPVSDLTWETTLKSDLGFDFGFLHDRISGTLDFYYNNTTNVLISGAPLTPSSGFTATTRNQGTLFNRGIELQVNTNNLGPKSPLKWKTTLNIATNQNRVTSLGNGVQEVSGTNYGNNYAVAGQPIGVWLLAQYAGINPETGQIMIDSAGHKVVATAGNTVSTQQPVGRPYPIFQGGLNNVFTWKGLELTVLLTFSYGNQIYDDDGKRQNGDLDMSWNQLTSSLNYWTTPGQITNVPKLSLSQNYDLNTTAYLFDASYLRLKRLVIAYYLPSKVVAKMKMRSFKIYLQGENLAVATKYPGTDPETDRSSSGAITQGVNYLNPPQARTYSFGFNMGF
jgi:TonB-linked SusC/RagA family outer membrane protein